MTNDLQQRLANLRLDVEPQVEERHLRAIHAALDTAGIAPSGGLRPRRRRRMVAVVFAILLMALPAVAVAAERSVPGELLYPVKRTTEWVRSLVDSDVAAEHRVEELERSIDRRVPLEVVTDRLRDAVDAVREVEDAPHLEEAIDTSRDRIIRDYPLPETPESEDTIRSDRPDLTESTTTVPPPEHDDAPRHEDTSERDAPRDEPLVSRSDEP